MKRELVGKLFLGICILSLSVVVGGLFGEEAAKEEVKNQDVSFPRFTL